MGERSEGLNNTVLPVTKAAETIPVGMANEKFHGEMTTATPRGSHSRWFNSPGSCPRSCGRPRWRIRRA